MGRFYEDGELVKIISASEKDPFLDILSTLQKSSMSPTLTQKQMLQKCSQIREYVERCKHNNTVIDFKKMVQRFDSSDHELQSTLLGVLAMDADAPIHLQLVKNNNLNSMIFVGDDDAQAFLVTKDAGSMDFVVRLSEIDLVSFGEDSIPNKGIGLVVQYSWSKAIISCGVMLGLNMAAMKVILNSEKMRNLYLGPQKTN